MSLKLLCRRHGWPCQLTSAVRGNNRFTYGNNRTQYGATPASLEMEDNGTFFFAFSFLSLVLIGPDFETPLDRHYRRHGGTYVIFQPLCFFFPFRSPPWHLAQHFTEFAGWLFSDWETLSPPSFVLSTDRSISLPSMVQSLSLMFIISSVEQYIHHVPPSV